MKRKSLIVFLALLSMLQVSALASPAVTVGGIAAVRREITVNFTVAGLSGNDDVTILVYKDDGKEPDEDNIVFIDQVSHNTPQIKISLSTEAAAGTYQVMMGGTGVETASAGTFTLAALLLGDVNGDGVIDTDDAIWILRYTAGMAMPAHITIEDGDVDKNETIDANDAVWILKYTAEDE